MTFISRAWSRLGSRAPLKPRTFANPNFIRIPSNEKVEEEALPDYLAARYYPVRIGEVFRDRYQVVGKLGFGVSSTVWLARDLKDHCHVALKVLIRSQALGDRARNEIAMYERMKQRNSSHPGREAVRSLLDSFQVDGPEGDHLVLAHPPLGESVRGAVRRSSPQRLHTPGLCYVLNSLFLALEYLHDECQIIHTDIKADNIMFRLTDSDMSVLADIEEEEMKNPCPRKEVEGRTVYTSRAIRCRGPLGPPVLCDFGAAVFGDSENRECVQPSTYRAPEVTLEAPWDYKIDIWNAGCMIWHIYEGARLFHGIDPEHNAYRSRAHLAEMIALLGPPPKDLLARSHLASKFFSNDGIFTAGIDLPNSTSLEEIEMLLPRDEQEHFLKLMRKMLQWIPERRSTAAELYQDLWFQVRFSELEEQ
ncbi:hypothetical protein E8E14_007789 [Neopestalotiopsis sp. 37M]|nr:hypothetical protein E8E14_007789 [Neopestalotiopsis sp. 37M]